MRQFIFFFFPFRFDYCFVAFLFRSSLDRSYRKVNTEWSEWSNDNTKLIKLIPIRWCAQNTYSNIPHYLRPKCYVWFLSVSTDLFFSFDLRSLMRYDVVVSNVENVSRNEAICNLSIIINERRMDVTPLVLFFVWKTLFRSFHFAFIIISSLCLPHSLGFSVLFFISVWVLSVYEWVFDTLILFTILVKCNEYLYDLKWFVLIRKWHFWNISSTVPFARALMYYCITVVVCFHKKHTAISDPSSLFHLSTVPGHESHFVWHL